jgi:hypothetical protein
MYLVGDTIEEGFSTSVDAETFTIGYSRDPAGEPFLTTANLVATGAPGNYLVTFVAELAGSYYAHWAGDLSHIEYDGNWEVEARAAAPAVLGTSRRTLRRRIGGATGLGDLTVLTANPGSTDVTLIDPDHLLLPVGAYLGRELTVVDGVASGQTRRVSGNSEAANSITVANAFRAELEVGVEAELWYTSGTGWHYEEANAVINDLITEARSGSWVPQQIALEGAFDPANPYLAIPRELSHVAGVAWQNEAGLWIEESPTDYPGGPGWYVAQGTGQIVLGGGAASRASNHLTQVRGYGPLAELNTDSDVTPLNVEWLVKAAVARLLLMGLGRRPENQVKYPAASRLADQARPFAMSRPQPNTVKVA